MSGKCNWTITEEPDKYQLKVASNRITIERYTPYGTAPTTIEFQLFNTSGQFIDGLKYTQSEQEYNQLSNLFSIVRDKSLRITATLNDIMRGLDSPS